MKVKIEAKFKRDSVFSAPQLKLKKDEVARIVMIDEDIVMGFHHNLNFGEKHKNNGRYKCLGDYAKIYGDLDAGILGEGSDPEVCPFCREGARNSPVGDVQRHFITNILRYALDIKGRPRTPLSSDIIVWRFSDKKFNRLLEIKEGFPDLRKVDLLIKCEQEQYQNYLIDAARNPDSLLIQTGKEALQEAWEAFKRDRKSENDLELLLSSPVSKDRAEELIKAAGTTSSADVVGPTMTAEEAQSLLDSSAPSPEPQPKINGSGVKSPVKPPAIVGPQDFMNMLE